MIKDQKDTTIFKVQNIFKSFGTVKALSDASVNLYKGKVMALAGENGAGKSTIIKCMIGVHKVDSGKIFLKGEEIRFKTINDSVKNKIAVVHQELKLAENLTVAENIFLGRQPTRRGIIDINKMNNDAQEILSKLDVTFGPRDIVENLSIAEQQMVEIGKALSINAEIIILDEPTDALSEKESKVLFSVIKKLKDEGISFLYVTHRMKEIIDQCDDVTIFRDGKFIEELKVAKTSVEMIIKKMIGRDLKDQFPEKIKLDKLIESYEFRNISNKHVTNVSFKIHKNEIVGLFGLVGSGRSEFARGIIGLPPKTTGRIIKDTNIVLPIKNISKSISNGIYYVTENRKLDGLDVDASIRDNMIISNLNRYKMFNLFLDYNMAKKDVAEQIDNMNIKLSSMHNPVSSLSGGNQQKVLLGKALVTSPNLLILDEPTRGVDVGARREIYNIMRRISKNGKNIMMISSDLPEVIGMSDRVVVFYKGIKAGELLGQKITEENIMKLATGTNKGDDNV